MPNFFYNLGYTFVRMIKPPEIDEVVWMSSRLIAKRSHNLKRINEGGAGVSATVPILV